MFTKKRKADSQLKVGNSRNLLLRLFRPSDVSATSLLTLESTDREDAHTENPTTIRNSMVETDYQNAKALLERARYNR